jgi:hypothetical protein
VYGSVGFRYKRQDWHAAAKAVAALELCVGSVVADDADVTPQDELAKSQIGARLARLPQSGHGSALEGYLWTSLLVVSLKDLPIVSSKTVINDVRSQCFLPTPVCYMPVVYFVLDELIES